MPVITDGMERILSAYHAGRRLAFFFDYDGTLTPIVRHPSLAVLPERVRTLLREFLQLPRVQIAVVSGRALVDLRQRVGLAEIAYAGSCGLELQIADRKSIYPGSESFQQTLDTLQTELQDLLRQYPGTWIERKPAMISVHFRGLFPVAGVRFRWEVANRLMRLEGVRFQVVAEAIEVTPSQGWDKGTAVEMILNHNPRNSESWLLPIYFGDSANDAEGMQAAQRAGGVSIGVGPDSPKCSEYWLTDTHEFFQFLVDLHDEMSKTQALEKVSRTQLFDRKTEWAR
jgi:trehalose 6-phosphate phosphatase